MKWATKDILTPKILNILMEKIILIESKYFVRPFFSYPSLYHRQRSCYHKHPTRVAIPASTTGIITITSSPFHSPHNPQDQSFWHQYLGPFFNSLHQRPVMEGDIFNIKPNGKKRIRWNVVKVTPSPTVLVVPETIIICYGPT
eukprot:TRINITY_DN1280_c0_g1_i6.p1 TRINITY_DN1280_c0_g1~~TRINITY_DN1280_c0_g1_i6.p1  ORF type:complete len:143 (+),score=18.34 TRINITY_DN1280_c0_g1_i6:887-1315(+)